MVKIIRELGRFLMHCLAITAVIGVIVGVFAGGLIVGGLLWQWLSLFIPSWIAFIISGFLAVYLVVVILEATQQ